MSATPARDALVFRWADAVFVDRLLAHPDLVLAALIESGWRPTDDQLRAMGGKQFGYAHRSTEGALEHSFLSQDSPDARPVWWFPKERADG